MHVAHVGLVHRDPCKCKVKSFCVVPSIERNVSKRKHLQGVRQSSSSSEELPNSFASSSTLLLVLSSAFLCTSCLTDLSIDRLPGMVVPWLPIVRVAISCRLLATRAWRSTMYCALRSFLMQSRVLNGSTFNSLLIPCKACSKVMY